MKYKKIKINGKMYFVKGLNSQCTRDGNSLQIDIQVL